MSEGLAGYASPMGGGGGGGNSPNVAWAEGAKERFMGKGLPGIGGGGGGMSPNAGQIIVVDAVPKDFEKVPAYRMKDGRILSREQALVDIRKLMLMKVFPDDFGTRVGEKRITAIIAENGDEIFRILRDSIKELD